MTREVEPPPERSTLIRVEAVRKTFGRVTALADVSFDVAERESIALWGGNGAGKTTLIRCLLGILRHEGAIRVAGWDPRTRGKAVRSLIGYVPQELAFHDDMRLDVAMSFFARLRGVGSGRPREILDRIGLGHAGKSRVRDLSGGMKQRLALGVALLADPPIIVLDEPTSNLDAEGREDVLHMLRDLSEGGKTIVFASHRPEEVVSLAQRVIVLENGRFVGDRSPAELLTSATCTLQLELEGTEVGGATEVLRAAGHTVEANGRGLRVKVSRGEKAAPIRVLTEARVRVRSFELIDDRIGGDSG